MTLMLLCYHYCSPEYYCYCWSPQVTEKRHFFHLYMTLISLGRFKRTHQQELTRLIKWLPRPRLTPSDGTLTLSDITDKDCTFLQSGFDGSRG